MKQTTDSNLEQVQYPSGFSILLHINNTSQSYSPHWHPAIEIIMPLENTYEVMIDHDTYQLQEEDIIIIPAGSLHELHSPAYGSRLIILIDYSLVASVRGMSSMLPVLRKPGFFLHSDITDMSIHEEARNLLLHMRDEYITADPFWEAAVYARLIQFFLLLGRKYLDSSLIFAESNQNKQKEYIEKFDVVFDYIHNNFSRDISLDSVAQIAGFSRFHFSRLFKQFTGMTFYDYLNKERIQMSETLLLNQSMTITEVAFQSGFSSISTFNRVFRTHKNCTPTEFRTLYQIK